MTSILGVESGSKPVEWTDEQLEGMMRQITRHASSRTELSKEKLRKLQSLEAEWGRRKRIPDFQHLN